MAVPPLEQQGKGGRVKFLPPETSGDKEGIQVSAPDKQPELQGDHPLNKGRGRSAV